MDALVMLRGTYGPQYGARILDRYMPGWWDMVDTDMLDMNSMEWCIAGQLFKTRNDRMSGFDWVIWRSPDEDWSNDGRLDQLERFGFVEADDTGTYMDLHIHWVELIRERRSQRAF
jgi:hypothetical protein